MDAALLQSFCHFSHHFCFRCEHEWTGNRCHIKVKPPLAPSPGLLQNRTWIGLGIAFAFLLIEIAVIVSCIFSKRTLPGTASCLRKVHYFGYPLRSNRPLTAQPPRLAFFLLKYEDFKQSSGKVFRMTGTPVGKVRESSATPGCQHCGLAEGSDIATLTGRQRKVSVASA
ncbi:hypothetical protein lerEdw1_020507 [Lerista edwardsae]|nr:hypothetical protein lerEdw1_020507 [Lerista edwardsae]